MKSSTPPTDPPAAGPDSGASYTLEVLSEMTGVSTEIILHYQSSGIIRPSGPHFDDEAVRVVRRMEHVRETCGMNLEGLRLLAALLDEVERLRDELRLRR
jgi:DNA-binding transcriptional MerR regulator